MTTATRNWVKVQATGQAAALREKNGKVAWVDLGRPRPVAAPRERRNAFSTAFRGVGRSLMKVMKETYWFLDRDAGVRSRGAQTVGEVTMAETRKRRVRDPEGDYTVTTHHLAYEFEAGGEKRRVEKQVGEMGPITKGAAVRVYYMTEGNEVRSALDRSPIPLRRIGAPSTESVPLRRAA